MKCIKNKNKKNNKKFLQDNLPKESLGKVVSICEAAIAASNGYRQRYKKWQPAMDTGRGTKSGSQQWTQAEVQKVAASNGHRQGTKSGSQQWTGTRVPKVAASNGHGQGYLKWQPAIDTGKGY